MGAPLLEGAIVQRVDVAPAIVLVRLRAPGATYHLLLCSGRSGPLVGLAREKPFKGTKLFSTSGVPLDEKRRWRTRLEGARLEALFERRALFAKEDARFVVECSASRGARVSLRAASSEDTAREDEHAFGEDALALLEQRGEALGAALGEGAFEAHKSNLGRALARALAKIERRMEAVRGDLARITDASRIAAQASSFVAAASRAPRGARELSVTDWSTGEPREISLKLDPARPAREQIDAMFKRARRLKLGAVIANERLAAAEAAWERLAELAEALMSIEQGAADKEALASIEQAAREAAPRDFSLVSQGGGGKGAQASGKARPYRVFVAASGDRVLVGRGAAHNDALTFRVARPHDLWLHAKDKKGAHVIVLLDKNKTCPSELLVDAATLAAHFSDARDEAVIDIQYAPRRYLRKPKGAAPGFVVVDREKVMALRLEKERLAGLLEREEMA